MALWSCLKNHMVEALQKPGLRLPTLEEVKKQTQLREELDEAARPAPSSKKRRISAKSTAQFEEE